MFLLNSILFVISVVAIFYVIKFILLETIRKHYANSRGTFPKPATDWGTIAAAAMDMNSPTPAPLKKEDWESGKWNRHFVRKIFAKHDSRGRMISRKIRRARIAAYSAA